MPYSRPHQLLILSGAHFSTDRWTIGFRLNNVAGTFPDDQESQGLLCSDYAEAVSTWWTSQSTVGANSNLDLVKLNEIGVDGRYVNGWTNLDEFTTPLTGTTGSPHAPQVALVATLSTGQTRGLSSKGRVYLPSPTMSVGGVGGVMSVQAAQTAAAAVKGLVDAINAVETGRRVVVASNVRTGAERTVQAVEVGCVLDTMRSRRSAFDENRQSAALAGAPF